MKTSVFVYLLVVYISTYVLSVTWVQNRKRFRGIGSFVVSFTALSIGISLSLFRGSLPDMITVVGANAFMFAGNIMLLTGMAKFLALDLDLKPYILIGLIFICLYAWFTFATPDVRVRIMLFSGLTLPIFGHTVYLVFLKADPGHRRYALNTAITMALFFLVYLARLYYSFSSPAPKDYFNAPMYDSFLQILGLCLTVFLTLSLHLMINGKLVHQAERYARDQEELATRDSLTSLYNRRKMDGLLKKEFSRFKRYGRTFCVVLCDIDYFKRINDIHGHDAGDRALVSVARLLETNIRSEDTAARWGGEEFLILLPETTEKKAADVAHKLRKKISALTHDVQAGSYRLTLSFGVSRSRDGLNVEGIVRQADQALYRAKNKGRNCVETHNQPQGEL